MFGGSLQELRSGLAGWAARFEPALVAASDCAAIVTEAATIRNIASVIEAMAAARVAETELWRGRGGKNPAEWLARTTGTTTNQAKDAIDTGKRLGDLDATADAAKRGELSPAQASAIADAATADPAAEHRLLDAAGRESLGELRGQCRRAKAAADPDPDATYRRIHRDRSAREYTDAEGAWNLHARTTPDAGAEISSVLGDITDEVFTVAHREGRTEAREAYAADALLELARRARDGKPNADPGTAKRRRERFLAIIRADLEALIRGRVDGDEVCEISGVGPIPVSVARDLLGGSILKLVLSRGVDVANVTHLGRGPTAAQKIALLWSQPICGVEGCARRARLEADHLQDWTDTHHTRLDELGHKCEHHHDLKSNHGWDLVPGTGRRPMVPPDDPRHPRNQPTRGRGGSTATAGHSAAAARAP